MVSNFWNTYSNGPFLDVALWLYVLHLQERVSTRPISQVRKHRGESQCDQQGYNATAQEEQVQRFSCCWELL